MPQQPPSPTLLSDAWKRIARKADARRLFDEAGLGPENVVQFYEALRDTPQVRDAFQKAAKKPRQPQKLMKVAKVKHSQPKGRFRLVDLCHWWRVSLVAAAAAFILFLRSAGARLVAARTT